MNRKPLSLGDWIIATIFGSTIVTVAAQVFCRYVLRHPLVWTEELSGFLFVWMTFVGAALAVKENAHFRVDLLVSRLPARAQRWLEVATLWLIAVLLAFLVYAGVRLIVETPGARTPALNLPRNYALYAALPAPLLAGCAFAVRRALRVCRRQAGAEALERSE